MIEIKNLSKSFGENTVLKDIHMHIRKGEFVSILGPSGCGKSTLINIVAGLECMSEGAITVEEKSVVGPDPERIMVFQNAALFPWMSVFDNVAFGLRNQIHDKDEVRERVSAILKKVYLFKFKDHYPHELSGGMKQRVSIARSLVMDPKVLLMDEPFSALDEQTRVLLQDELQRIWMETGKTILFVTHHIREAVKLSDRVFLLGTNPGRVIDEVSVNMYHPRRLTDPSLLAIEQGLLAQLEAEIEKQAKEEFGDEYSYQKNTISWDHNHTMGGGI